MELIYRSHSNHLITNQRTAVLWTYSRSKPLSRKSVGARFGMRRRKHDFDVSGHQPFRSNLPSVMFVLTGTCLRRLTGCARYWISNIENQSFPSRSLADLPTARSQWAGTSPDMNVPCFETKYFGDSRAAPKCCRCEPNHWK